MTFKPYKFIFRKRLLVLLLILIIIVFFFHNGDNGDFLINGDWNSYDENIGENVGVAFLENGEYFYNCDCGEPVGASDAFDSYKYDAEKKTIKLSGPDNFKDEIKILYADDYFLVLKFSDNTTRVFENSNNKIETTIDFKKFELIEGMTLQLNLLDFSDGKLTVAPFNYDRDAHESFENHIFKVGVSKKLSVTSITEEYHNGKLTKTDKQTLEIKDLNDSINSGYFQFNNEGLVEKIVLYGCNEVFD